MQIYVSRGCLDKNIKNISEFLELNLVTTLPTNESYFQYDKDGLSFVEDSSNPRSILHVDFLKGKLGWRLKRAQHEGNLKKALGKKDKKLFIFDAIYLDPMYPIIKKSTKKRGSINSIKQILEFENLLSNEKEIIDKFMK